jgi:hypothetical protein
MSLGRHRASARRQVQALLLVIVYALALPQFARSNAIAVPAAEGLTGLTIPICSATGVRYVRLNEESAPARAGSGSSGQIPHPCCGICPCGNISGATPTTVVLNRRDGGPGEASRPVPVRDSGRLQTDHFDARAPPFSTAIIGQDLRRTVDS